MELLTINNVWMMICTALVFFMHLGFSFLEIGLTRQKNTINILFKNFFVITSGLLIYCIGGFNLMYPGFEEGAMGILKFAGFGITAPEGGMTVEYASAGYTWWTDFLFQGMFAATAATIVSGAVAERIKLNSFMLFSIIYVGLVYPIIGSWKWGGGFLDNMGFYDLNVKKIIYNLPIILPIFQVPNLAWPFMLIRWVSLSPMSLFSRSCISNTSSFSPLGISI